MATRQTVAIAVLTDYTQSEEDIYAAELLAAGAPAGNYIFNTEIGSLGNIRFWNGAAFENTTPIPPLLVPLATQFAQGGIPAFGSSLQVMRVNSAGTALEFFTLTGGGDMLKSENLSGLANYTTSRSNLGLVIGTDVLAPAGNGSALTGLTKTQVGLSNADNTSDLSKPISTAMQTALDLLQVILVSAVNIKTINGSSVLGAGNLVVSGATEIKQTEIDFGSLPLKMMKFTVTDATIVATNKISACISYDQPSDGDTDSAEWFEELTVMARAGTGQFFLYVNSPYADTNGKIKINYIVGT